MAFLRYLRDHLSSVFICACTICVVWVVLAGVGVGDGVVTLVCVTLALAELVKAIAGFMGQRRFWSELRRLAERDDALDVVDTIDEPPFYAGRAARDALEAVSCDGHTRVCDAQQESDEYRSYIEAWVHEVKTPIAASRLILENNLGPQSAALGAELERIDGYVEQALYYARSSSVDRDYAIRRCNLRDVVSGAVKSQARSLIDGGVGVRMGSLDTPVLCDAKWMRFVLGQLIQNSVKYRADPSAGRSPALSFDARREAPGTARERVILSVSDNGRGIPASDVPRVFDRGFVGDNGRRADQAKSTGLGLFLVRRLCDKMGVGVSLTSVEGESTTVELAFAANSMHYLDDASS